jgi:hypothetical protein
MADPYADTTLNFCYPPWHAVFQPLVHGPAEAVLHSGCTVNPATSPRPSDIDCDPEAMRQAAEHQLQTSAFWPTNKSLTLDTYALARNIQSEVGSGTPEERVALAETTINRALQKRMTPAQLILMSAHKRFGEIQTGNPSNRFTASSQDPSILSTLIADFVLSGQSNNFAQGADDQDGLEFSKYFPDPVWKVKHQAQTGDYWVGPLPGVDHWKTTLWHHYGYKPTSAEGQALIARALPYFSNPRYTASKQPVVVREMRPAWPLDLPICGQTIATTANTPGSPQPTSSTPTASNTKPAVLQPWAPPFIPPPVQAVKDIVAAAKKTAQTIFTIPDTHPPVRGFMVGLAAVAGVGALGLLTYQLASPRNIATPPFRGIHHRRSGNRK